VATYTPFANYAGPDSFSYKVNDGQFDSAPATVVLNVTPVNDAPVAYAATASTSAGTAVSLLLQASDIDNRADNRVDNTPATLPQPLTFRLVTLPSRGSVTLQPDGRVVYTPLAGFTGTDSFTYVVNDGQLDSNVATATINVTAAPPPPPAPRVINGTGARDTLVGNAAQDEIFIGGAGADTLSGNGGVNTYRYLDFRDAGDTITDFTVGRDFIDFKALLISLGYVGSAVGNDPAADSWVRIIDGAAGAQVQVAAGAGNPWRTMVTLRGVRASAFDTERDLIWR
jgi:Bacterial Ig domain/Peptidase M10 serralysin C terminal